jgi:hypothetical protein
MQPNVPDFIMNDLVGPALASYFDSGLEVSLLMPVTLLEMRHWIPLIAQYELSGRQIFDLSDNLVEMLNHTDVRGITLTDWQSPYDCFFVRFGKQEDLSAPFGDDMREYIDGAFIAVTPASSDPDNSSKRIKIGFTTVKSNGEGSLIHGHYVDLTPQEAMLPIDQAMDEAHKRRVLEISSQKDPENMIGLTEARVESIDEHFDLLKKASKLLVNAIFYIETIGDNKKLSPGRDTPPVLHSEWHNKPMASRRKVTQKLTKNGYGLVYLVGREFDGAPSPSGSGTKKTHWVRGHFRQQPHGKGRLLRKVLWIKPHVSGTKGDISEADGHIYVTSNDTVQ